MTNDDLQRVWQVVVAVGLVMAAVGGYFAYSYGKRSDDDRDRERAEMEDKERARATQSGVLTPAPPVAVTTLIRPELEFGDSGAILSHEGTAPVFAFMDGSGLTIGLDERGRIRVSGLIRDSTGAAVAELVNNEWKINPSRSFDRNYSDNALEVRDAAGDVVLQLRLVGKRVQVQAKLFDATGRGLAIGKIVGPDGKVGGGLQMGPPLTIRIDPMFLYPSALHLSELSKPR